MNTEINFLENKPKKYIIPLILGLIFVLLLLIISSLLLFQQNKLESSIAKAEANINQYENLLKEQNESSENVNRLRELGQEVDVIKDNVIPNVALYKVVLDEFTESEKMVSFNYNGDNQFVIEGTFDNLDSVANYLSAILEQGYIIDGELSNIVSKEGSYLATLTFFVNPEEMREELAEHE